jgi:thiamine-phosphate pyrophosphorylase
LRRRWDWSLYLVTDRQLIGSRSLEEVVRAAVQGGVCAVQLREKYCSTREFIALGKRLKALLDPRDVPLIINDRVDVALAVGAAGVHLGQSDMECGDARRLLGPEVVIGLSVETMPQAEAAQSFDLDYLAVSPLFATPTKTDTAGPWGLERLALLKRASRQPLVAIGGINAGNAAQVIAAGADGLVVVSAICAAADPEAAARELRRLVVAAQQNV